MYAEKLASGRQGGKGGLSPQTVGHFDRLLHTALRTRLIAYNPVDDAKHPKVERRPKWTLSTEE